MNKICKFIKQLLVGNWSELEKAVSESVDKMKEKKERKEREKNILDSCGCIVHCPDCREPLNDKSDCRTVHPDGLYEYTCVNCGKKSRFHFGIAPVPIYMNDPKEDG